MSTETKLIWEPGAWKGSYDNKPIPYTAAQAGALRLRVVTREPYYATVHEANETGTILTLRDRDESETVAAAQAWCEETARDWRERG